MFNLQYYYLAYLLHIYDISCASGFSDSVLSWKISKSSSAIPSEDPNIICEGDKVEVSCSWNKNNCSVAPILLFRATPNDITFKRSMVDNYLIENATSHDSGYYVCYYDYDCGIEWSSNMSSDYMTVLHVIPPHYTNPTNIESTSDGKFKLTCPLESVPEPEYHWSFEKKISSPNNILPGENNKVIQINRTMFTEDTLACEARNRGGAKTYRMTSPDEEIQEEQADVSIWLISSLVIFIAVSLAVIGTYAYRKWFHNNSVLQKRTTTRSSTIIVPDITSYSETITNIESIVPYQPAQSNSKIFKKSEFKDVKQLSCGNFGSVSLKLLLFENMTWIQVAVKSVKDARSREQRQMLALERLLMEKVGQHPNILSLIGVIEDRNELHLVTEFCEHGSLKDYLRKMAHVFITGQQTIALQDYVEADFNPSSSYDVHSLSVSDLLHYAWQIANGMEFLSTIPCVHRDLAARNVLLTARGVVRIADFGLARQTLAKNYYRSQSPDLPLPFKWMALELFFDDDENKYTQASDVWSFGVVLWELFSLGATPFPSFSTFIQLRDYLNDGRRLEMPVYASRETYELMMMCWSADSSNRPAFNECRVKLGQMLKKTKPELFSTLPQLLQAESDLKPRQRCTTHDATESCSSSSFYCSSMLPYSSTTIVRIFGPNIKNFESPVPTTSEATRSPVIVVAKPYRYASIKDASNATMDRERKRKTRIRKSIDTNGKMQDRLRAKEVTAHLGKRGNRDSEREPAKVRR